MPGKPPDLVPFGWTVANPARVLPVGPRGARGILTGGPRFGTLPLAAVALLFPIASGPKLSDTGTGTRSVSFLG